MATTAPESSTSGFRPGSDGSDESHGSGAGKRRPSGGRTGLLISLIVLCVLGGVAYASWQYGLISPAASNDFALTHTVSRADLLVTVTEDGNVESASNVEAKCEVAGGATILWIIPDGTEVEAGEVLVRLDQSIIEDQLNTQKITYEKALATKIQAEEDFSAAKISVTEYIEGTYLQNLSDLEAQVTIALENLRSSENMLEHTQRMARKGFATPLQLEADEFAVQRATLELESAKTAKHVLEAFTREKTLKGLEATRDAVAARMRSEQAAVDLEKAKLDRLEEQLTKCVITAPQKGMVVYNNQQGSRFSQQQPQVEEGAAVRERQVLINLPDLSKMQVKVTVHESKVEQIHAGMPARIAIQDRHLKGHVVSVANQPEPTSFFSANVKEYATVVRIDGEQQGLKPGMTAEVEILIAQLSDVLTVPVAAVVEQRGRFYCWVQTASGPERRPLVLGLTNDTFIEIKDGVSEGERVLLNPRAVVSEARDDGPATGEESSVEDRFGKSAGAGAGGGPGEAGAGEGAPGEGGRGRGGREPGAGGPGGSGRGGEGAPGSGAGGGEPGGAGGRRGAFDPMQFDADKDGKLSKAEAPERMQQFFDRIDGNSDGVLDASELSQMRSRSGGRGGSGAGGPGGGGPGAGGRGADGGGAGGRGGSGGGGAGESPRGGAGEP